MSKAASLSRKRALSLKMREVLISLEELFLEGAGLVYLGALEEWALLGRGRTRAWNAILV